MYNNIVSSLSYLFGTVSVLYVLYKFLRLVNNIRLAINRANQLYKQVSGPLLLFPTLINTALLREDIVTSQIKIPAELKPGEQPFRFIPEKYLQLNGPGTHEKDD